LNNVLYVTDFLNHSVRKITKDGTVTTLAGTGVSGFADGAGATAKFDLPMGLSVDGFGNVFVADNGNAIIRKITPLGVVSTFAGKLKFNGNMDGQGTSALFNNLRTISIDAANNVYASEVDFNITDIRKITPSGLVSTFAGGATGYADGVGTAAKFGNITGTAIDELGNLYVVAPNFGVRKITQTAAVSTIAGIVNQYNPNFAAPAASIGSVAANLTIPHGIVADEWGDIYVSEMSSVNRINLISRFGGVTTFNTDPTDAFSLAVDDSSNLFIAEPSTNRIRKIPLQGYTISPALPPGLTMDSTGTISGTPTKVSATKTYTIRAYNESGYSETTIKLGVIVLPPVLSYNTPNIFVKNTAITPLVPTNTGAAIPNSLSNIYTTFAGPGIAYLKGNIDATGKDARFMFPYTLALDKIGN
jgi:hypothetical protein